MVAYGLESQMLASLYMLKDCIDRCPDNEWNESQRDYPFSEVVFHALFDCDYSLSENNAVFREQQFHRIEREIFGDYEELKDSGSRPQRLYERAFVNRYYEHCSKKIVTIFAGSTYGDLIKPNSDIYKNMTKMERYINAIRHIQHHSAQLGLRLQFSTDKEMEWISRGHKK